MLIIKNLRVSVGGKKIVKGVSLVVKPGEIHAVMGPNGSGKSTLAYALAGHPGYEVAGGSVEMVSPPYKIFRTARSAIKSASQSENLKGSARDILSLSVDERARAGLFLAFQYPVEVPGVRVSNFLRRAYEARFSDEILRQSGSSQGSRSAQNDKLAVKSVASLSRRFGSVLEFRQMLEKKAEGLGVNKDLIKRGLNEGFSGGEKKRLEILQMAVLEPKYAVLDETDSGLDIDAIKAVAKGVRRIVKEYGTGMVVITHYQRILKYLRPDKVHVMVGGKIVESGGGEVARRLEKKGYKLVGR